MGNARYSRALLILDALERWAHERDRMDDAEMLARFGEARGACEAARMLVYAVVDERVKGLPPSPKSYIARVAMVRAGSSSASRVK